MPTHHFVELLSLAVVVLGPVPWCLAVDGLVPGGLSRRLLPFLVTWCLFQTTMALCLGFFGMLRLGGVLIAEALLFLSGLAFSGASAHQPRFSFQPRSQRGAERFLLTAYLLAALMLTVRAMATPITDYDSLAYHLPAMAKWYQAHRLAMLDGASEFRLYRPRYYPFGWEALAALFLFPFGEDFAVALPNVLAWVILGLAVYRVAVTLGAQPASAAIFSFLFLTTPILREQIVTMHVDLAFGAFFMAAVAFALDRSGLFFLSAVALMIGIKTSGLVYAPLLLAAFCWATITRRPYQMRQPTRTFTVVISAATAITGLFWYTRNFALTGNPLGFVRVNVAGFTVFPGPVDADAIARTTLWGQFNLASAVHWEILLDQIRRRFGLVFLLSLSAAWIGRAIVLLRERREREPHPLLLLAILGTVAAYCMTPSSGSNGGAQPITPWIGQAMRYAFPCAGLVALSGALAATGIERLQVLAVLAIICSLAAMSNRAMAIAAGFLATAFVTRTLADRTGARRWLGVGIVAVIAVVLTGWLRTERARARSPSYGGLVEFIDHRLRPGDAVAYVSSHRRYPLYGSHLDKRVLYLPAGNASREEWLASLRAERIALLAIGPFEPGVRPGTELSWVEDPAGPFERVFAEDARREVVIYRLRDNDVDSPPASDRSMSRLP